MNKIEGNEDLPKTAGSSIDKKKKFPYESLEKPETEQEQVHTVVTLDSYLLHQQAAQETKGVTITQVAKGGELYTTKPRESAIDKGIQPMTYRLDAENVAVRIAGDNNNRFPEYWRRVRGLEDMSTGKTPVKPEYKGLMENVEQARQKVQQIQQERAAGRRADK